MKTSAVALCFAFFAAVALARKGKKPKVDTSDVVRPDPKAVDTDTEEYGALVEGDIKGEKKNGEDRNAVATEYSYWEDAVVPYIFDRRSIPRNSEVEKNIREAMKDYHDFTCIRWVPRRNNEKAYVKFKTDEDGCWALLGKTGSEQPINLQNPGCTYKGTIIHEMLHTLGFAHEQSRNDRDRYIRINYHNMKDGKDWQFHKMKPDEENHQGFGYDFASVMHYGAWGFSKNGKKVIETLDSKNQDKIGQRAGFSKQDIKEVNKLYECHKYPGSHNGASGGSGGSKPRPTPRPTPRPATAPPSSSCRDNNAIYCARQKRENGMRLCNNDKVTQDFCKKTCGVC